MLWSGPTRPLRRCGATLLFTKCSSVGSSRTASSAAVKDSVWGSERRNSLTQALSPAAVYPSFVSSPSATSISKIRERYRGLAAGQTVQDHKVTIAGRVLARRDAGKNLVFMDVRSNCGTGKIQVLASKNAFERDNFGEIMPLLRKGDIIEVSGHPGTTNVGELSVKANVVRLLSPCLHDIPDVLIDVSQRAKQRHLEMLVNPKTLGNLKLRAKLISHLRQFLDAREFLEVETPILSAQAGGANARPFTTKSTASVHSIFLFFRLLF